MGIDFNLSFSSLELSAFTCMAAARSLLKGIWEVITFICKSWEPLRPSWLCPVLCYSGMTTILGSFSLKTPTSCLMGDVELCWLSLWTKLSRLKSAVKSWKEELRMLSSCYWLSSIEWVLVWLIRSWPMTTGRILMVFDEARLFLASFFVFYSAAF